MGSIHVRSCCRLAGLAARYWSHPAADFCVRSRDRLQRLILFVGEVLGQPTCKAPDFLGQRTRRGALDKWDTFVDRSKNEHWVVGQLRDDLASEADADVSDGNAGLNRGTVQYQRGPVVVVAKQITQFQVLLG